MIILTPSDQLKINLDSAVAANQCVCFVSYRETDASTFTPGRNAVTTNNTTPVVLLSGVESKIRGIDYINIYNADTAAVSANIVYSLSSTDATIWRGVLEPNERVEYNKYGFVAKDDESIEKTFFSYNYSLSSFPEFNTATLSANFTNTTVTFSAVDGLGVSVTSGKLYWFRYVIRYQSASTANGAQWALSGTPSFTYLNYYTEESNTATTIAGAQNISIYNGGALAGSTINTPNARAIIEGLIEPSSDGVIYPSFRSEVAATAIIAISGSFVEWEEIFTY